MFIYSETIRLMEVFPRCHHPWMALASWGRELHISMCICKGVVKNKHEAGLTLVIPRRMPHHSHYEEWLCGSDSWPSDTLTVELNRFAVAKRV